MDTAGTRRGRMPRPLSRALFVLGGAVAATAAGWLISSATAAADPLPVSPPPAVSGAVLGSASDALTSVGVPAKSGEIPNVPAVSTVPAVPAAPAALPLPGAAGVTKALGSAVSQLGDHVPVDRNVVVPALTAWSSTPLPVSTPAGQSDPAAGRASVRALPVAAAANSAPAPFGAVLVQRSVARPSAGIASAGTPRTTPALPVAPAPAPWTPVTVPAVPGGGGAGAAGAGGLGFADHSGTFPVPGLDAVRVVPVTAPLGRVTTGRQPGITPD